MSPVGAFASAADVLGIPAEPYHVGIVTRDLEEGAAALTDILGLQWAQIVATGDIQFTTRTGEQLDWRTVGVAHSTGGPMHVELLQGTPGSVWYTEERARLHHYAYWVDD